MEDLTPYLPTITLLLKSILEKAGEKVTGTIGEKLGEHAIKKSFWQKIKSLFSKKEEQETIKSIEQKNKASSTDILMLEQKLKETYKNNPDFIKELKEVLNINAINEGLIINKLKSIERIQKKIEKLELQMENAGIGTKGDYMNQIENEMDTLYYQIDQIFEILNKK